MEGLDIHVGRADEIWLRNWKFRRACSAKAPLSQDYCVGSADLGFKQTDQFFSMAMQQLLTSF
jgi:hypothetical protein